VTRQKNNIKRNKEQKSEITNKHLGKITCHHGQPGAGNKA